MSLDVFSAEEHQRLVDAESKYGNAFVNAYNTTILLSNLMMWPVVDCDLFIRFYSQMKKYHTLSVVSTIRLNRIQAKMDLRYFLKSTANAAFSLAHTDTRNYFDLKNNRLGDAQKATTKAYKWLETTYSAHSNFMRELKAEFNEQTAHAHVVNSQHNFDFVPGKRAEIITSYFAISRMTSLCVSISGWPPKQVFMPSISCYRSKRLTVNSSRRATRKTSLN